jgi:hypothetical protein
LPVGEASSYSPPCCDGTPIVNRRLGHAGTHAWGDIHVSFAID